MTDSSITSAKEQSRAAEATGETADEVLTEDRRRAFRRCLPLWAVVAIVLVALAVVGIFDLAEWSGAVENLGMLLSEMWPPDFERWRFWLPAIVDTLAMSVAGTGLAALIGLPLGLLASANSGVPPAVAVVAKGCLAVIRSVPEIGLGLILVVAVGQGAIAGTVALAIYSVGMLGKFTAEAMDHVDPHILELGRALRLKPVTAVMRLCLPSIAPRLADYVLYRWEHNVRASAILGLVGAGGIGFELVSAFRVFAYEEAAAILVIVVALVLAVEWVGWMIRKTLR